MSVFYTGSVYDKRVSHDFEADWLAVRPERHLPKGASPYRVAGLAREDARPSGMPTGPFSVAVWFKATESPHPLVKIDGLFDLQLTPDGHIYFQPLKRPGLSTLTDESYVDGDWHQVLVSFDGDRIILAVDAVYWVTSPWPVLGHVRRAAPSTLSMGDVALFDEVLDHKAIQHVYNGGDGSRGLPSRIAYWRAPE